MQISFEKFFFFQFLINLLILPDHQLYITHLKSVRKFDLIAVKYSYRLIHILLWHRRNPLEHQNPHFPFFAHGTLPLNNKLSQAYIIQFISLSEISVICLTNWMDLINKFLLIQE